ncbi:MAG: helix-turn-helix transcriptional regulator [Clostridia bacterium]|nr:helix-turn-helix transcriptional regulator [Clostridia bacterium]
MISYDPLWRTLKAKKVPTYKLIKDFNVSKGTLDRLRKQKNITMETLDILCDALDCSVSDIIEHRKNPK